MAITVELSSKVHYLTGGAGTFSIDASNLSELIAKISAKHPRFGAEVLGANGQLARYMIVTVGGDHVRDVGVSLRDGCRVYFYVQSSGG